MKKFFCRFRNKVVMTAVVFLAVFSLPNCKSLSPVVKEPVVSISSVDITGLNFTGAQLLCKVQVENPNTFEIPFPETDWEFFINNNSFVSGVIKNDQRIRARQKVLVDVPVTLEYRGIFNTFRSLKGSQKAAYKIALALKFATPVLGDKVWNIEREGELPLPQLPKLSAPSMRIESRDNTRANILVTINVENPNIFDLPPIGIKYDYQVNRNSFIKGETESGTLTASAVTPLSVRLSVVYADLFRIFVSLLTSREVSSSISLTIDSGIPAFGGETFNLNISGSLPLR